MSEEFERIERLPPYVFAEVNEMKRRARVAGRDIIDFGMGNPDTGTPTHIVDKLVEVVRDPRTHRYSNSRGIPGLRKAMAAYYQRRFGVALDPESEIITTLGSKEGLANLAQAMAAPGDIILAPNPSYPIHPYGFVIAGATVHDVPCGPGIDTLEELERAVSACPKRPKALVLNFPNNPTAEVVDLDFYERVVAFAREAGIYILSDLAYAEIFFDDEPPPSILQIPGARDIAVEFTSLSKTYSMPGWRIGFAAGNARLIRALTRIKSYLDYGAFTPIQVAATAALKGPQGCIADIRARYRERRDVLVESFEAAGWSIPAPRATMFAWAPIPEAWREVGSLEFSKRLLADAEVAVSPGIGFGTLGEGFVRIALVENRQRIRQAARNVKAFLAQAQPAAAASRRVVIS
ncbi:MAG: LL-diaminopimelate aminotransferase [Alphaproteobacteria bacterium]|jgi:alanine-synthesizing transaminase|nr:LL-diaminopimelate aminotransferase [Alphaproteobacteria bacterium]MDP6237908.1 LL-diaminopimelate aminotransferase [Alphaproteobacteria bacterium]MDP7172214.1 LL-diaminopimelate aminotransferase [Alphaproteobacteria bacterium]MDP7486476.1 LL-diaminopimelate aminotransferase [Alphaproteobacteria bacterium]HJN21440.1 LL-diaminopimelate aminotransferase [Alphaproteobacteria bacterium]|tara:strand:+ start:5298 stop:6515 length:1218 start_codon:yes stop_codon:yes gene_type:complete